jgi:hypothetical protein
VHPLESSIHVLVTTIATQLVHQAIVLTQTLTYLLAIPQLAKETIVALLIGQRVRTHAPLISMLSDKTIQLSSGNQHGCPSLRRVIINVLITSSLDLASRNVALLIVTEPHGTNHF